MDDKPHYETIPPTVVGGGYTPGDEFELNRRSHALQLAADHHKGAGRAQEIITDAELYLAFLKGIKPAA